MTFNLTEGERAALLPVQNAITAKDWQAAQAALPAAMKAAVSPDALYAVGRFELEIGVATNDISMQTRGLDHLITSKKVPAADLPMIYRNRAVLARNAADLSGAETAFAKVVELSPRDPEAIVNLAQVKVEVKKPKEAVTLMKRAIELKRAAGQQVEESWYKYALKIAFDGRSDPALAAAAKDIDRQLLADYPTDQNWRDALIILRDAGGLDSSGTTDVLRLMRASGALLGERDWYDLADGLIAEGNYAEAKAVLDGAIAKRMIDPNKAAFAEIIRIINTRLAGHRESLAGEEAKAMGAPTGAPALKVGDAWYGYGDTTKAIAMYRAALRKGGVDLGAVNTHLGMALLASGNRAGAESAFKSVSGARKQLGDLWILWLHKS